MCLQSIMKFHHCLFKIWENQNTDGKMEGRTWKQYTSTPPPPFKWLIWSSLSWLPASLTKIQSKMSMLAKRYYKFLGFFLDTQGHLTRKGDLRSGRNSNLCKILCLCSLSASLTKIGSKLKALAWRHRFPHYKSIGAFCCHGNQSFNWICPKCLCSLSPHPRYATYKIWSRLANWPQRYSSLKVWTTTDGQQTIRILTISSPCEPLPQVS